MLQITSAGGLGTVKMFQALHAQSPVVKLLIKLKVTPGEEFFGSDPPPAWIS